MSTNNFSKKRRFKHLRASIIGFLTICIIIGILGVGLTLNPNSGTSALIGKLGKNFEVKQLQSPIQSETKNKLNLSHFRGKPLVLNFWASWCFSCREEASEIQRFWELNKGSNKVSVVGIAIQDSENSALEFAKNHGKTYYLGLDEDGKAGIDYGITGVPETFFIDENGKIVHKIAGPVDLKTLEFWLSKLTINSKNSNTNL